MTRLQKTWHDVAILAVGATWIELDLRDLTRIDKTRQAPTWQGFARIDNDREASERPGANPKGLAIYDTDGKDSATPDKARQVDRAWQELARLDRTVQTWEDAT